MQVVNISSVQNQYLVIDEQSWLGQMWNEHLEGRALSHPFTLADATKDVKSRRGQLLIEALHHPTRVVHHSGISNVPIFYHWSWSFLKRRIHVCVFKYPCFMGLDSDNHFASCCMQVLIMVGCISLTLVWGDRSTCSFDKSCLLVLNLLDSPQVVWALHSTALHAQWTTCFSIIYG